jgi:glycosyltransferase involved in cell wall biosynthesis
MRILFALPGAHRVGRGAEVAFESIAQHIAVGGGDEVTLTGSGEPRAARAYRFRRIKAVPRGRFERWPKMPLLRHEYMYEELTFAAGFMLTRWRRDFDVTVTCSYPYLNWALRSSRPGGRRPAHVFVTQNGDWPAALDRGVARLFGCEGLVCTNPLFFERNRSRWRAALIPNGIDPEVFHPGAGRREGLGLPLDRPVVLMASALVHVKRVAEGMRAVARIPDAFFVVAGDGPLRDEVDRLAAEILPGRFLRRTFPHHLMPELYRSADVFLHTCLGESFGNVYVEALASGLPVVAHEEEVARWVLDGHARLVDTREEDSLVHALKEALAQGRTGAAERAAFAASRYGWNGLAARYRDFLAEVVGRA